MRVIAFLVALAIAGCAAPATQRCHRYDAIALTRENGFATTLDWKDARGIDAAPERVEVALTVLRPLQGPIELVHVLGDVEVDRWALTPADHGNIAGSICWVPPPGTLPNCGAVLQDLPYFPSGYYYLRANGNTVLEAALAFYVCD